MVWRRRRLRKATITMETRANTSGVPRIALLGAAGMIALAFLTAGAARLGGVTFTTPTAAMVATQDLRFEDQADGGIGVWRVSDNARVDTVPPGTNGFIRGALRGLARSRKQDQLSRDAPFRLTAWADGRLTLEDLTTHETIDLEAFGKTNEQAFADILMQATRAGVAK
jgi:putative photosynthetic complex assembly protein